jgi:voltage-gated potassium channel Kch
VPTITVFFLTILISMHTSFVRERRLVTVLIIDCALLALGIVGVISENEEVRALSNAGFGLLLFATGLVVLRRVLGHQTVTSRTLSGAVSAFLFVGLAFACFAEASVLHNANAYVGGNGNMGFATMLYFSFVTIATLGYGDIVPVTSYARSLATMEAIMGQIYLVTIVARLVSLLGMGRLAASESTTATDDQGQ